MSRGVALALASLLMLAPACDRESPGPVTEGADTTSLYARLTESPRGGRVHLVRMVVQGDTAAFEPAEIHASPGDVVRFVMAGSRPETIAFTAEGLTAGAAAFIRDGGLSHGELLTRAGQVYDVSFRDAPPGRYPFHSVPHLDRGMRGIVVVE